MIKWSHHQEDTVILNVYVSKKRVAKYAKQKLTELKNKTHLQL